MSAFLHHLAYDFKTGVRDRTRLLMNYLFPLGFFLVVSGLMSSLNPLFKDMMLPAMTLFAVMACALLSLPALLVQAREAGVFRSFRINGVPAGSILTIPQLGGLVHMAVVAVIIALLGPRLYQGTAPADALGYAAAGILAYAAISALGALIGVVAGSNQGTILLGQAIYLPSMLLGGLMVPAVALPPALARLSLLLPTTHAMRLFDALGMRPGLVAFPWVSLAVLGSGAILGFALSAVLFQWDTRQSQPLKLAPLGVLALAPYVVAVILG